MNFYKVECKALTISLKLSWKILENRIAEKLLPKI